MKAVLSGGVALLLVLATQRGVWARLPDYEGDDFWNLSPGGRLGLFLLSLVLIAALQWAASRIPTPKASQALSFLAVASASTIGFAGLIYLAPQVYYLYYMQLIPDLPLQWVAGWPPMDKLYAIFALPEDARAAEHLTGAAFWSLMLAALWRTVSKPVLPTLLVLGAPDILRLSL